MIGPWTWFQLTNAASGLLFVALGLAVARVGARERANAAFAAFAIAFGLAWLAINLGTTGSTFDPPRDGAEAASLAVYAACLLGAAGALLVLAARFPAPPAPADRRVFLAGAAFALATAALLAASALRAPSTHAVNRLAVVGDAAVVSGMLGAAALFALRYPGGNRHASAYAVMAAALAVPAAFSSAIGFGFFVRHNGAGVAAPDLLDGAALLAPSLLLAVLWLGAALRAPAHAATARNVALVTLGALLAGAVAARFAAANGDHWGFGATRTAGVVILAYAIVRHQLLGIDVKLRWTISRGTIGASFVAVFFVVSEGAQALLGASQGPVVGVLAAGALVFALAPLQRVAERIAHAAVPVAGGAPSDAESAYRAAVRIALRDGVLTQEEERALLRLAEHAGISATRALAIHEEMERAGPAPPA